MNTKHLFFILLMLLCQQSLVKSQVSIESLPSYLNSSNAGTEFYITTIPFHMAGWAVVQHCYFYFLSDKETEITIESLKHSIIRKIISKPFEPCYIGLNIYEVMPFEASLGGTYTYPPEKIYENGGVRITSKEPIIVCVSPKVFWTSDADLILPLSSWGKEYTIGTYESNSYKYEFEFEDNFASICCILAGFDSTSIDFTLLGNDSSETFSGQKKGESKKYLLNKGDVLPIITKKIKNASLIGSKIISDKPIGVISGSQCTNVPNDVAGCNMISEMELPLNTWGKTFHVTQNKNRNIGYLFQVVAKDTNTSLFINGQPLKVLRKNDLAEIFEWGEFNRLGREYESNNFVISSDKPISLTVFNQSFSVDSVLDMKPFQMVVTPLEQYRNEIKGCSFNTNDQSGYPNNFLNVVYPLDSNLSMPEDLQWGESNGETMVWMPFKDKWGDTADFIFEGFQDGKKYAAKFLTLKNETIYQIRCNENIAAFAYGHSSYEAYGVPAYLGLRDLTVQDSLPPMFQFVQSADGTIEGINGNKKAVITDLHHPLDSSSKLSMVYCQFSNSVNYDVQIDRFIPGDDATTNFTATVVDKSKDAQFVITAIDRAGNDTTILVTQKATISSAKETESETMLRVIPNITNNEPISIIISNAGESLSIVSITGKTVHTFENIHSAKGIQTLLFNTAELSIGMYYVLYSVNGKQYQQCFVKMK